MGVALYFIWALNVVIPFPSHRAAQRCCTDKPLFVQCPIYPKILANEKIFEKKRCTAGVMYCTVRGRPVGTYNLDGVVFSPCRSRSVNADLSFATFLIHFGPSKINTIQELDVIRHPRPIRTRHVLLYAIARPHIVQISLCFQD